MGPGEKQCDAIRQGLCLIHAFFFKIMFMTHANVNPFNCSILKDLLCSVKVMRFVYPPGKFDGGGDIYS